MSRSAGRPVPPPAANSHTSGAQQTALQPTWKAWFNSRDSANIINTKAQEKLIQTLKSSLTKEECAKAVEVHQQTAFLYHDAFGEKRVSLFHHFTTIGGTVYEEETSSGFIKGIEEGLTLNMMPDTEVLFAQPLVPAVPVPTITTLLGLNKVDDIDTMAVGNTTTYKPRDIMPIVPFLLPAVSKCIRDNNGSAGETLLVAIKEIKEFDNAHAGDIAYKEKAKQKCRDILMWLYVVAKGNRAIQKTQVTGCNSLALITKLNAIEKACVGFSGISPTKNRGGGGSPWQAKLQRPLEQLAASASSNQDILRTLTKMQAANEDKSSKSFKKIPAKYQKMILVASSVNKATMVELNPQASEFFKSQNTLHANITLNSHLEMEQIDCSISNAMMTSLLHGSFLWINSVTPSKWNMSRGKLLFQFNCNCKIETNKVSSASIFIRMQINLNQ